MPKSFSLDYFRQQGKKGGKIGGHRAAAAMTPAQRKARATKASQAAAVARSKKKHARQTPIDYSDIPASTPEQLAALRRVARTKKKQAKQGTP